MDGADAAKRMAMAMGFYTAAEPVATVVPMMIALGNHDLRMFRTEQKQSSVESAETPYLLRPRADIGADGAPTALPPGAAASVSELYYSFTESGVRVLVLNTEEPYRLGSAQQSWLREEIKSANEPASRRICPWLVVMMHRPMYFFLFFCDFQ